jgi:hypothetical protein
MPKQIPTPADEKSYHDWLTEALARDAQTWEALEARMKPLRVKRGDDGGKVPPRDC